MVPMLANTHCSFGYRSARFRRALRVMAGTLVLAGPTLLAAPSPAAAQIAALINGEPITVVDIAQRTRLIQLSTQKTPSRQEVLDELIDDKLKVNLSKRYIADVPKREIESSYASIARRTGATAAQFTQMLKQQGLSADTLKARIHADFVWQQIIRGKFQGSLQVGEKEVEVKLQGANKSDSKTDNTAGFEYRLQPVLLLVPKGAAPPVIEARKREADGLRARFQSCDEGLRVARTLQDVAVRDVITRASADVPQKQRELLNETPIGHLTPPDVTFQGVEMFAVCGKTPASGGETPAKREAREAIYQERFQAASKKFLKELRAQALIEIR
jgi:peptidyl-prolyl cis-trans isomerase SurA